MKFDGFADREYMQFLRHRASGQTSSAAEALSQLRTAADALSQPRTAADALTRPDPCTRIDQCEEAWNFENIDDDDLESCQVWELSRERYDVVEAFVSWRQSPRDSFSIYSREIWSEPPLLDWPMLPREDWLIDSIAFWQHVSWPSVPWRQVTDPAKRTALSASLKEWEDFGMPDLEREKNGMFDTVFRINGVPRSEAELIKVVLDAWRRKHPKKKGRWNAWDDPSRDLRKQYRADLRALGAYRLRRSCYRWPEIEDRLRYRSGEGSKGVMHPGDAARNAAKSLAKRYRLPSITERRR